MSLRDLPCACNPCGRRERERAPLGSTPRRYRTRLLKRHLRLAANGSGSVDAILGGCVVLDPFQRILTRAGVEPGPRLIYNRRASRETELAAEFPIHVVTAWLGNTPAIAMRHYLQTTDADFERAAGKQQSGTLLAHPSPATADQDSAPERKNPAKHEVCGVVADGENLFSGGQGIRTLNRLPGT